LRKAPRRIAGIELRLHDDSDSDSRRRRLSRACGTFECVSRIRYVAREYWFELLIAFLAIAGMLELVVGRHSPGAPSTALWISIPTVAVLVLPLFARRRFPFAAPAAYWLLAMAISFGDGLLLAFIGSLGVVGLASAFLLGNLRNPLKAGAGLIVLLAGIVVVVYNIPGPQTVGDFLFIPLRFVVAWVAGYALRERAERAEAAEERAFHAELERETTARIAVAEERTRIARELHDIVAHAVSVMVLQVGAVRHNLPAASEDHDLLRGVERAGRTALAEMRRLLAAMRREGDEAELSPQPGLDGLDSLLDEVNRAGLPVELHVDGTPFPLPRGIDLSAYRIVQEGLTNALKHAHASDVDVTVRYRPDELEIEVRDNGQGSATNGDLGHGLIGIRERVMLYDGKMTAGTAIEGGFVLTTRLPLAEDER
jgi:signal transduction histidine kinase